MSVSAVSAPNSPLASASDSAPPFAAVVPFALRPQASEGNAESVGLTLNLTAPLQLTSVVIPDAGTQTGIEVRSGGAIALAEEGFSFKRAATRPKSGADFKVTESAQLLPPPRGVEKAVHDDIARLRYDYYKETRRAVHDVRVPSLSREQELVVLGQAIPQVAMALAERAQVVRQGKTESGSLELISRSKEASSACMQLLSQTYTLTASELSELTKRIDHNNPWNKLLLETKIALTAARVLVGFSSEVRLVADSIFFGKKEKAVEAATLANSYIDSHETANRICPVSGNIELALVSGLRDFSRAIRHAAEALFLSTEDGKRSVISLLWGDYGRLGSQSQAGALEQIYVADWPQMSTSLHGVPSELQIAMRYSVPVRQLFSSDLMAKLCHETYQELGSLLDLVSGVGQFIPVEIESVLPPGNTCGK